MSAGMIEPVVCANSACRQPLHREVISVNRRYFQNCNDHDEVITTEAFVVCSWSCLTPVADEYGMKEVTTNEQF